jgi:hypothetical protein
MHTIPRPLSTLHALLARAPQVLALLRWGLVGGLALVLLLVPGPAQGQSFPGAPDSLGTNLRAYPMDLWSPRVGPGAGLGLVVHNLGRRHGRLLLTAAPARQEQVATLSYASANPAAARRYVLLDARGLHTNRDWIYGLGPAASDTGRVALGRSSVRVSLRTGQRVGRSPLILQPEAHLSLHRMAPSLPEGQGRLTAVPAPGETQTGVQVGLSAAYDTRTRASLDGVGLLMQGSARRYLSLAGPAPPFDQFHLAASGRFSLGGSHRLAARLSGTLTTPRGDAPVPYYLLPAVEGALVPGWARGRFRGRDRLMGSLLYRAPIAHFGSLVSLQGYVGGHLASVYDDVRAQFEPTVSFDEHVASMDDAAPLRPSASVGVRLGLPFRNQEWFDLALGLSPEGLTAVRMTFARPVWDLSPVHHGPNRRP